jgi:hypothetical protein
MKRLAALALLLLLAATAAACGDSGPPPALTCAIAPGAAKPDAVDHLGCAADYVTLGYTEDPFVTFARTNSISVIVDRDADTVFFLDTEKWWLHFDYIWQVVEHHAADAPGYTDARAAFSTENYYSQNRRYILGKIVQYQDQGLLVFSLSAGDRAGAALVREAFTRITPRLYDGASLRWRPVSNDQERLMAELADLPTITSEELFRGQTYQPLNAAVGFGTLRFVRASTLAATPPLPTDIAVMDRVPADVPVVSGIVTAEFQTPLSHVNILAKNRGTPNMALRDAFDDTRLRAFEGQLVKLTVTARDFTVEPAALADAQAYWEALRPKSTITPGFDASVTGLQPLGTRGVGDLAALGGKASNFAEMARAFPTVRMPSPAFAVPLSAFDAHMTAAGLWPEFEAILAERAAGTLDDVALGRRLFHLRMAVYQAPLDPAVRDALHAPLVAAFGDTEIRLRSSTNVEDLAGFSGAGLYTSVGVVPSAGPEAFERALKVVWSSAFNYAAFVEREFYRVDQRQVRMGVLVHASFPDEIANGVALTQNSYSDIRPAFFINAQIDDVSVTNPSGAATPEQILWYTWYQEPEYEVLSRSSLHPDTPVLTDAQYADLATQLTRLRNHFNPIWCQIPGTTMVDPGCAIDVEWKLRPDGQVWVKQARPLRGGGGGAP